MTYDTRIKTHYEAVQVNITIRVPMGWLSRERNTFCSGQSGKKNKDAYDNIKSLLNYHKEENVEIRDIEFAMIRFYLSQLSPYEMQIKESEDNEQ